MALGEGSTPLKAIMAKDEHQFVFLTPGRNVVSQFDIETEKIIADWAVKKNDVRPRRRRRPAAGVRIHSRCPPADWSAAAARTVRRWTSRWRTS